MRAIFWTLFACAVFDLTFLATFIATDNPWLAAVCLVKAVGFIVGAVAVRLIMEHQRNV